MNFFRSEFSRNFSLNFATEPSEHADDESGALSYYAALLVSPTNFGSATPKASVAAKTPTGGPFPQCNHYSFGRRLPPMLGGFCEAPRGTRLPH